MIGALLQLLLVSAPTPAAAHAGCGGHELLVPRQYVAPTDVASSSNIKGEHALYISVQAFFQETERGREDERQYMREPGTWGAKEM